ncbi:MAG: prepilin peptidase [Patescibacteria group bacterium]
MQNPFEVIFLAFLFIFGIIICYEDFRFDKIRNKWIKWGFIIGVALYLLQIIYLIFSSQTIELHNYWQIILNTLIAFVLGFTLWYFKLWSGGDAKLFTLFVFLLPISFYSEWNFIYWPPLNLLINITIPIFIYLLIKFLLYPFQLLINYLKNPHLLKEYYRNYKSRNKLDKKKINEYLAAALSFVIILIFFQIIRVRLGDFLHPYLGSLMIAFYFFMGFVVFQPLRKLMQKRIILALISVIAYFVAGIIFFRNLVFADLHNLFAVQLIFMLSYYYIFKYGKALIMFLYNSAEVRMIPVEELQAGVYINKDYVSNVLGNRFNLENFKNSLDATLANEDKEQLWSLLKQKSDKSHKEKQYIQLVAYLNPQSWPYLIKQIFQIRKQKKAGQDLLEKISAKLNLEQKSELENILNHTDEFKKFLKSIRGKLTAEQADKLKAMIMQRNEEIKAHGLQPIDKIILHKTFAFAPFMLLGVIITLVTKSSLIHLIYVYILHK